MENFFRKGYTVFADNYYNSVKLANFMSKKQTYICSTLRSDRKGNPKEVVSKKLKKGEVESKRRETCSFKMERQTRACPSQKQKR